MEKDDFNLEKEKFGWLVSRYEYSAKRYMEAEDLLMEIMNMPWWKRLFKLEKIILNYIKEKNDERKN